MRLVIAIMFLLGVLLIAIGFNISNEFKEASYFIRFVGGIMVGYFGGWLIHSKK